jgi:phosphatidylglycerol---prolipoprotein diacylglyceryl transferase
LLQYPKIDPIAFHIGPLAVHWYGLMYLFGILGGWFLGVHRAFKWQTLWTGDKKVIREQLADFAFYIAFGVIIGGRVGSMLFYNIHAFLHNPLTLFEIWDGGMSFHGGMLGVFVAVALYGRKHQQAFFDLTDFIAPLIPIGLGLGRLGNFINDELWGRVTHVPWGMVFPTGGPLPRHPSQLYEFFLEGVMLFTILWVFSRRDRPRGAVSGLFLLLYGLFRFGVEFVRQPDANLGFIAFGWLTMGQLLSLPMIILGAVFLIASYKKKKHGTLASPCK